jgi:hypothetical protein
MVPAQLSSGETPFLGNFLCPVLVILMDKQAVEKIMYMGTIYS